MSGRPCKPDADLKGLWRTLIGTPFPACGIAEDSDSPSDGTEFARSKDQSAEQDAKSAASDRQ
jgi:hypothetical protein